MNVLLSKQQRALISYKRMVELLADQTWLRRNCTNYLLQWPRLRKGKHQNICQENLI
jgi:hypothetical protein